jgi:hypothetical protein
MATASKTNKSSVGKPKSAFLRAPDAIGRLSQEQAAETFAYTLGVQSVLWGAQWVKASEAFRLHIAPLAPDKPRSPYDSLPHGVNVWGHAQKLLTAEFRIIETPNTETLYSSAIVDLGQGPVVVVHPDFAGRYFRSSIWDLHSDTHTISQKQDGDAPPPYALVWVEAPGDVPAGMETIELRSRYVLIALHTAVYGDDDLPNVHELQKGLKNIALKDWGTSDEPIKAGEPMRPIRRPDSKTPDELMFFEELCETLKDISVREDEVGFARQLEQIGITLRNGFQFEKLDPPTVSGLKRAVLDGQTLAAYKARDLSPVQRGGTWSFSYDITNLDNWLQRAGVGFGYVWGDLGSEILYPSVRNDSTGEVFSGANKYVLHFAPDRLPPARYWRISMYDIEGFFVSNPANRFGIGNMAEKLESDADGGLTIYIQNESPGKDKEANWLPCPKDGFFMVMRLYQPEERMYRGEYIVPAVTKVA